MNKISEKMVNFYRMSISAGAALRKEVEQNGEFIKKEWNHDHFQYDKWFSYKGDLYRISSHLGIIDIQ